MRFSIIETERDDGPGLSVVDEEGAVYADLSARPYEAYENAFVICNAARKAFMSGLQDAEATDRLERPAAFSVVRQPSGYIVVDDHMGKYGRIGFGFLGRNRETAEIFRQAVVAAYHRGYRCGMSAAQQLRHAEREDPPEAGFAPPFRP